MAIFDVRTPLFAFSNSQSAMRRGEGITHTVVHIYGDLGSYVYASFLARTACGRDLRMVFHSGQKRRRMCGICEGRLAHGTWQDPLKPVPILLSPPVPQFDDTDQYRLVV